MDKNKQFYILQEEFNNIILEQLHIVLEELEKEERYEECSQLKELIDSIEEISLEYE
jgi:hypothetical protein